MKKNLDTTKPRCNKHTVELRYNKPLYNEVLSITNDILHRSNSQIYDKEPRYNETSL